MLKSILHDNKAQIEVAVASAPDWTIAADAFDKLWIQMADPSDKLWSDSFMNELREIYFKARDNDKSCGNITDRTVRSMPAAMGDDTKKVFLQIANVCRFFHAGHKVNFEGSEIPLGFNEVAMAEGKKRGTYTYADEMPTLYPKISLTFDYWIPKFLEWTDEIRSKKLDQWRGEAILQHESCTDFMRVCLLFLSDPLNHVPVAKADEREILLRLSGQDFLWIKKSDKRENILVNSENLKIALNKHSEELGMQIPLEAWSRILKIPEVKVIFK